MKVIAVGFAISDDFSIFFIKPLLFWSNAIQETKKQVQNCTIIEYNQHPKSGTQTKSAPLNPLY